jgi:hypothetical protein
MEADRLHGLFAACADARDDLVRVLGYGAARGFGSLGESIGYRVAMEADRFDGVFAARADASRDLVRDLRDSAARRCGSLGKPIGD